MIRALKYIGALAVVLLPFNFALAQDASVSCTIDKNPVQQKARVNLTLKLTNCSPSGGNIPMPSIDGLRYLRGPAVSKQYQSVNFKSTSLLLYTYTYQVIANKDIEVPAIKLNTSEGILSSKPFKISVGEENDASKLGFTDVGAEMSISKRRVHLGEPVLVQYKMYCQYPKQEYQSDIPELEGFWKETLDPRDPNEKPRVRNINGIDYNEKIINEVVAFPQQTGEFKLDGFQYLGVVGYSRFNQKEVEGFSNPASIIVEPLPAGKPNDFLGTFENLQVEVKVNVDSVDVNQAFNFEVVYSGKGNLKLLREPAIEWASEFEVFDPEILDQIKISPSGESGRRTYKYAVIPRAPGDYELPNIKYSYFDYNTDKYLSDVVAGGDISIHRGENEEGTTMYSLKSGVQVINHDIRHIATEHGHFAPYKENGSGTTSVLLLYLFGPLLAGVAVVARRRKTAEEKDSLGTRHKRALKVFNKSLNSCSNYTQLGEAIEVYLCSKLGCGRSSFTRASAAHKLSENLSEDEASAWDGLMKNCEMARYAPGTVEDLDLSISKARELSKGSDSRLKVANWSFVIVVILMSIPGLTLASGTHADYDQIFTSANAAYMNGDYEGAVELYSEIEKEYRCFELEYNLGNAHYKLENVGKAILHYERASLIDPLNDDLRANMLLADLRAIDKIEPLPGVGIDKMLAVLFAGKLYGVWCLLSLVTWTLGFSLIAIRLKWKDSVVSAFAKPSAAALLVLSIIFSVFFYYTHNRVLSSACGIVMEEKIDVMSTPGNNGVKLFHLHEGAKGCIISEDGEWTEIRLENGNVGWLPTASLKRI